MLVEVTHRPGSQYRLTRHVLDGEAMAFNAQIRVPNVRSLRGVAGRVENTHPIPTQR